jgi:hypothetical protein
MAQRVECIEEKDSQFPKYFSGVVTVHLASGKVLSRLVPVNLGSGDRALSREDIVAKFRGTAGIDLERARVASILDVLLSATPDTPVRAIAAALRG